jgi:hypothetical protein
VDIKMALDFSASAIRREPIWPALLKRPEPLVEFESLFRT